MVNFEFITIFSWKALSSFLHMSWYFPATSNLCLQLPGQAHLSSSDCGNSSYPDACKRLHKVLTMKRDDDFHSMSNSPFQVLSMVWQYRQRLSRAEGSYFHIVVYFWVSGCSIGVAQSVRH